MDELETGLNFRKDELESRHAAMEEREEEMNELKRIRFYEHEKLMSSLKLKEEACKDRFEELNARDVAMEKREEEMNELWKIRFSGHEKLKMELQERSQRLENMENEVDKANFAAAMNNMESKPRQIVTRTKVFGVSLQNINEVCPYQVSQSMSN